MVDVEITLIMLVIWRVDIGNYAVAVPLKVSHFRIFGHDTVYDAEHVVLNFGVRDVRNETVSCNILRSGCGSVCENRRTRRESAASCSLFNLEGTRDEGVEWP